MQVAQILAQATICNLPVYDFWQRPPCDVHIWYARWSVETNHVFSAEGLSDHAFLDALPCEAEDYFVMQWAVTTLSSHILAHPWTGGFDNN